MSGVLGGDFEGFLPYPGLLYLPTKAAAVDDAWEAEKVRSVYGVARSGAERLAKADNSSHRQRA